MTKGMVVGLASLLALTGCATKRDLRDLRTEVASLREAQDASLREIQRQNRMMLDSLSAQNLRTRGNLSSQLVSMERQLVQIQELTGQGQQRLADLREQINARAQAEAAAARPTAADATAPDPQELFDASLASLRRGSFGTARAGFEEFLRTNPQHPLAPEALFYVGEAYAGAKDVPRAIEAYGRVVSQYPNHPRAAAARAARDRLARTTRQ